jgi:hypothetical protein
MPLMSELEDTASATEGTLSKSEFAERIGVSPGRVTQYISTGKISDMALVGSGRGQRIRPELAIAQLRARLDAGQMLGNGKRTRLENENSEPVVISTATVGRLEAALAARFNRARDEVLRLLRAELTNIRAGGK